MNALRFASVAAILLFLASPASATEADGIVAKRSSHGVAETVDRLEAALKEKGLTVFARIDHAAGASDAGLELRPTTLLIFGNPKLGTPLMQAQQTVGLDLPQKALVYEAADGQVFLAYNDPAYVLKRHGVTGQDEVAGKIAGALDAFSTAATKE